ncbi:MAG: hypothetical protein KDC53_10145 [Saprospiraceae bacterium]|nr:hypothetical protein [Saprospiraceae bacterium]
MKYVIALSVLVIWSSQIEAQNKPKPYLFENFMEGTLFYATAPPRTAKFNYHLVGQEIVMDFENKKVPVNNFPNLDSVQVGDHTFIVVDGKSYEKLIHSPIQLLVDYKYTSQIEANEGAYGTKSHAAKVVVANQRIGPNDFYALEWNEGYELVNRSDYIIVSADGKWSKFNSVNQLAQIFKDRKKEIKAYASEHKTEFTQVGDIEKLVQFAISQ